MGTQTNRKSSSSSAKSASGERTRASRGADKNPRRREITAAILFILSVFSFIAYFNAEGVFIGFFIGIAKGLLGYGFFALAPVLLLCAVILCFHRGRPVLFRVICTLLLTIAAGALIHLIAETPEYELSFGMLPQLWSAGREMSAGGAVAGALSELFAWLFGMTGAVIVFICMAIFLLMSAFNLSIVRLADAYRNRERRHYVPQDDPEPEPEPGRNRTAEKRTPPARRNQKRVFDIPLDDGHGSQDHFPKTPEESLFKSSPGVKTPDQVISEYAPDADEDARIQPAEEEPDSEAEMEMEMEDIPLDIPFMEKRRGGPKIVPPPPEGKAEDDIAEAPKENQAPISVIAEITEPGVSYTFPPVDLLAAGKPGSKNDGSEEIRMTSQRLESAFRSFGVNVNVSNATRGPTVTRYEAELEAGVKLNKLTSLADDIALSLGTSGVRIAAMPNKISTVGIEVPNKNISKVYLRDVIESPVFTRAKSKLTFAIGMDISGDSVVGNISKLPHMLVAGTTGSGKSVCLNSIILSILYKAKPEDVRFIMIDPKMVEFKVYNTIPHLLVPVVTDVKKAAGALQWAVVEMMKRYALFAETNSRDLEGYNQNSHKSEEHNPLPQIVVVIDELADLMMMAAKEVEESICRVAQMGRAAGVHLIIATQSPRADVITGLMKANIPSRIALKVSSALESRIILDAGGNADKLVGNGDMLYAPIGTSKPMRIQGTWVSDSEREKVVEYINRSEETQYSEEVMSEIEKAATEKSSGEKTKDESEGHDYDDLLPQAVDVIFETGQASVSMLQRRLKLGYSRAARIVDQMEEMGVVGPFEGSKPRAVLVTKEEWRQMQYVSGVAPQDSFFAEPVTYVPDDEDL